MWTLLVSSLLALTGPAFSQDADGDGVPDAQDTCPGEANPNQGRRFMPVSSLLTGSTSPWKLDAGDLDLDGDPDVVVCHNSGLGWFENQGAGAFGPYQVVHGGPCVAVAARDVDGDLQPDLVASCEAGTTTLCWFANQGWATRFSDGQSIATGDYVYGATATDLDDDGDGDVAYADLARGEVAWVENLGGSFGAPTVLTDKARSARWVGIPDLDGDGDPDVIYASGFFRDNQVGWFENLGGGAFGPLRPIGDETDMLDAAAVADLDGDGDLDVMAATEFEGVVGWWRNDGAGNFAPMQVIAQLPNARAATAADLDGDGDLDLVVGSGGTDYGYGLEGALAWFENLGGGTFGPKEGMGQWSARVRAVVATDLDGDVDPDVVYLATEVSEVGWFENAGFPSDLDADGTCDASDPDADGDGVDAPTDCDDLDPDTYPGAADPVGDGVDQDCDGADGIHQPPTDTAPTPVDSAPPGEDTCPWGATPPGDDDDDDVIVDDDGGCGCATPTAPPVSGIGLALALAWSRRRRPRPAAATCPVRR